MATARTRRGIARAWLGGFGAHGLMLLALVAELFPFYWLLNTAFKFEGDNFHKPPYFVPPTVTLGNFRTAVTGEGMYEGIAFKTVSVLAGIKDSLIVATANTLLCVCLGMLAAYSISRFRTGGKNVSFWILSNRFLPPIIFAIPLFLLLRSIGFLDTHVGLILVYCTFNLPFAVWFILSYLGEMPIEVEEAGLVDGCTRIGVVWRIVLPLAAPGVVVAVLFCFLFAWNEYTFAFLLAGKRIVTLPVMLPRFAGSYEVFRGLVSAAAALAVTPAVILATVLQRFLKSGLSLGAIK